MIWALHGNLGHPTDWAPVEHALGSDWNWEKPNLWEWPMLDFGPWAARLNDMASALYPKPILMGYSLGGRLAMHALTQATPPLWQAAIFISAHPGLAVDAHLERALRREKDEAWAASLRVEGPKLFLQEWNAQPVFAGEPISSRHEIALEMYQAPIEQAFEFWSLGRQADLRQQLLECAVPQLWVAGSEDKKFRALAEEAVEAIPHARLSVIPGCGHRVPLQKPRELAECVREFLLKTEP